MKNKFSTYLAKKEPLLKDLIKRLNAKYDYASVLGTDVYGKMFAVNRSSTNVGDNPEMESGFVFRIYHHGISHEYATNEVTLKSLPKIEAEIAALVNNPHSGKNVTMGKPNEEALTQDFVRKNRGKDYSTEKIVALLSDLVQKTLKEKNVANVQVAANTQESPRFSFLPNVTSRNTTITAHRRRS